MIFKVKVLINPSNWNRQYSPFHELNLEYPNHLHNALQNIAIYLNTTYGKDNWYLSEAGQFVHRNGVGGDCPVAILEEYD